MNRVAKTLKKYIIPHEENDHRPHLLRAPAVAFVCLLAVIVESAFLFGSSYLIPRSQLFGEIIVEALVSGTNQARIADGLPALNENALLDAAAAEKANDMVKNDYFAHTSPSGLTPWYWFENVGYRFTAAGENLAVNFADSSDVTNAWLNSPEHRANILNSGYTDIGMATAEGTFQGHPAVYVVELFGTPAAAPVALAPVAQAAAPSPVPAATTAPAKPALVPAPVVVTTTASGNAAVAVAGANTTAASATPAVQAAATATAPANVPVQAPASAAISRLNPVQSAAANPRRVVDYIYLAIVLLFGAVLVINMFMKVHLRHPQAIFGGMLVVLVAGLLIVLNQHFGAAGVVIL